MKANFVLILCFFILSTSLAQTSLRLNLAQGKEYRQNSDMKMTMTQSFGGQSMDVVVAVKGMMKYLVKGVTPTAYDIDVMYESMSIEMQLPQSTMRFSSENPAADDMMSQVLSGMTNKTFQVQLSKSGKVLSVKNIDSLLSTSFDKFPTLTEAQKSQIKSQLEQRYGEKAFASTFEMMFAVFPDKPVKIW